MHTRTFVKIRRRDQLARRKLVKSNVSKPNIVCKATSTKHTLSDFTVIINQLGACKHARQRQARWRSYLQVSLGYGAHSWPLRQRPRRSRLPNTLATQECTISQSCATARHRLAQKQDAQKQAPTCLVGNASRDVLRTLLAGEPPLAGVAVGACLWGARTLVGGLRWRPCQCLRLVAASCYLGTPCWCDGRSNFFELCRRLRIVWLLCACVRALGPACCCQCPRERRVCICLHSGASLCACKTLVLVGVHGGGHYVSVCAYLCASLSMHER
jgi:hypothetical protein